jgi:hypothetical protein
MPKLKLLTVALVVAGILSAGDRDVAEWVIRQGGTVKIEGRQQPIRILEDLPEDLRLVGVDLIGTLIAPTEMSKLSGLQHLKELLLPGPSFNPGAGSRLDANDEFKALAPLKSLEKLHFSLHFLTNINVQDKGLAHIAGLTNLRESARARTTSKKFLCRRKSGRRWRG